MGGERKERGQGKGWMSPRMSAADRRYCLHVLNMLFGLMTTRLNERYYKPDPRLCDFVAQFSQHRVHRTASGMGSHCRFIILFQMSGMLFRFATWTTRRRLVKNRRQIPHFSCTPVKIMMGGMGEKSSQFLVLDIRNQSLPTTLTVAALWSIDREFVTSAKKIREF